MALWAGAPARGDWVNRCPCASNRLLAGAVAGLGTTYWSRISWSTSLEKARGWSWSRSWRGAAGQQQTTRMEQPFVRLAGWSACGAHLYVLCVRPWSSRSLQRRGGEVLLLQPRTVSAALGPLPVFASLERRPSTHSIRRYLLTLWQQLAASWRTWPLLAAQQRSRWWAVGSGCQLACGGVLWGAGVSADVSVTLLLSARR